MAEKVFDEMAAEAGVIVLRQARLEAVKKAGSQHRRTDDFTWDRLPIGQCRCPERPPGKLARVRAKMFIDATYEGDLMAAAGVSYTLMREGNAKYGEQFNGIYYSLSTPRALITSNPVPTAECRVGRESGIATFRSTPMSSKATRQVDCCR